MMLSAQLRQDYAFCEKIIKASSKSFYTAFSQLPKEKARAVYAIYAFCRLADDTVDSDDPLAEKIKNLQKLEEQLKAFDKGHTPDEPMWRALRDVFTRYKMDVSPFFDQLEGQKRDLSFKGMADLSALEEYSYYVAGSVGLMLLPILSANNEIDDSLRESAVSLGIAMQLTNILRDVGEDFRDNNRIYLPSDLLLHYGIRIDELMEDGVNPSFIELWENIAMEAERRYGLFWDRIDRFDEDCRFPVYVAAKLYRAIIDSVRENNYNCLQLRNYVPEVKMMGLVLEARKKFKKR